MTFWDALFDHLVLVHVLLPCVACLIACVVPSRRSSLIRWLVLQICLLSAACGIALLLRFDPQLPNSDHPAFSQLETVFEARPVPQIPPLRFSVGVDGLNLWYLVSLPWVTLSLALWESALRKWTKRDFVCLGAVTAGVLLALAARDVMLMATGAALGFLAVLGWVMDSEESSNPRHSRLARSLIVWGVAVAGTFLLGAAVAMVAGYHVQEQAIGVVPQLPLTIDELVFGTSSTASRYPRSQEAWRQQSSTVFLAWSACALLCVGAIPMQELLVRSLQRMATAPRVLLVCGLMPIGGYILARMALPLLGSSIPFGQGWITWPVLITLVWHLGMMAGNLDENEGVLRLVMSSQALALVGIVTGTAAGICGGILVSLVSGWLAAAWSLSTSGATSHPSRIRLIALTLLAGIPGGGTFAGLWLLGAGIIQGPQQRFISGSLLLGVFGLLLMLLAGRVVQQARSTQGEASPQSTRQSLWVQSGGFCLLGLAIVAGVFPGKVVEISSRSIEIVTRGIPSPAGNAE